MLLYSVPKMVSGVIDQKVTELNDHIRNFEPSTFADKPTILMCPPDYFDIEYEINPWMHLNRHADRELARRQWDALYQLLLAAEARVLLQPPRDGLPDLVFTANAALIWGNTAYLSRFRHPVRQGETPEDEVWFHAHGMQTRTLPHEWNFEGAGDALFCGDTLFGGYLTRSDARAFHWLGEELGVVSIPLQLVDPRFYHLDTCFCPLNPEEALYFPEAFDDYGRRALERMVPHLIPVAEEEAVRFACNAVVVGKQVFLNTGCPKLEQDLHKRGYQTHPTDLSEFLKSGGSSKCLTLRLDGEEAAAWRT